MDAPSLRSTCPRDQIQDQEYTLREWNLKARRINRDNTVRSRRFSGSYVRSFREEEMNHARSFRSNMITSTISSTASSPGYNLKDEIDPSTYSFTTALKALQARSGYVWECLSPDGLALNSKWSEAERYICNPLSGEVPMECLSSKAVSGRSNGSNLASGRISMSAPMVYSSCNRPSVRRNINFPPKKPPAVAEKEEDDDDDEEKENHQNKTYLYVKAEEEDEYTAGKKFNTRDIGSKTRDVGIQSTPPYYSPSSSITTCSSIHNGQESKCCFDPDERKEKDVPDSDSNPKEKVEVVKEIKELQQGANQQQITQQQRHDEQQPQAQTKCNINDSWEMEKKTSCTTRAMSRAQLCGGSRKTGRLRGSERCGCGTVLLSWKTLWRRRSDRKPKSRSNHFTTTIIVTDHVHHNHQVSSPSPSSSTSSSSSQYCSSGPYQRQPPKTV